MTDDDAMILVKSAGILLESARGPVPNLADTVAGESINGSWWKHSKGHQIFQLTRSIRNSPHILVCRLVLGKITYVHKRLWPALVCLAERFDKKRLAAIHEMHTSSGQHEVKVIDFPDWVSTEVKEAAENLTEQKAVAELGDLLESILLVSQITG